ncbi:lipopolysaccharide biosynthesis protein [Novisyntrophococcus fermenticellae]|uniref:lipopolysaccharide biosynthesis protein n=1 Tax=Novisyntrophococcus fermenticellae TaxID=2068655 RepID=UPI001E2BB285|nr:hypothetical protein [Novisyntrophococcus fermenticellae]
MNIIFLISVVLKGFGALLEILLQITITKTAGLSGYGIYTTWINFADLIFWCLFSGIVKSNTFYLSGKHATLKHFKIQYYTKYVLPVIIGMLLISGLTGQKAFAVVPVIALAEVLVLDRSSSMLTEGKYLRSLTGEYVIGRLFLLAAVLIFQKAGILTQNVLILLYLVQYLLILVFFAGRRAGRERVDVSGELSLWKLGQYQRSDIMQAMIGQMPVILQYLFVGSFEAGVVGVVLLVKKLINFISGPTAKIFLPEFSRLYHVGRKDEIRNCFASIMRIQMMFAGPLAVVLLGYPGVILKIMAEELSGYTTLFMLCSAAFLIAATLGPCGGLMQMTGSERMDNRCREAAILVMLAVFMLLHKNPLFALYGLCIQTLLESSGKYIFVCRWMEKAPVRLKEYIAWWAVPAIAVALTYLLNWQNSFKMMVCLAGLDFLIQFLWELKHEDGLKQFFGRRKDSGKSGYGRV